MSSLTIDIYDAFVLHLMELYKPELWPADAFDSASGWTFGDGWFLMGGEAYAVDPEAPSLLSREFIAAEPGVTYDVEVVVDSVYSGSLSVALDGDVAVAGASAAGTFSGTATVGAGNVLSLIASTDFQGDVSAVSIKKNGFVAASDLTAQIKFPGIKFSRPPSGPWLDVRAFWNGNEPYALANDGASIERGFFRIGVVDQASVPLNTFLETAEELVAWFAKGTALASARIEASPSIGGFIEEEAEFTALPVTIEWRATRNA